MDGAIERVNSLRGLKLVSWWQQPLMMRLMEYKQQSVTNTKKVDANKDAWLKGPQEGSDMSTCSK